MGEKIDLSRIDAEIAACRQNDALIRHRRHPKAVEGSLRDDENVKDGLTSPPSPGVHPAHAVFRVRGRRVPNHCGRGNDPCSNEVGGASLPLIGPCAQPQGSLPLSTAARTSGLPPVAQCIRLE